MPGNETVYKSPRAYLPIVWVQNNVPVGADLVMGAAGLPVGTNQLPVAKAGAVTAMVVLLSEPVTNGTLTITLRKNDANTTQAITFTSADGVSKVMDIEPGTVPLAVNDTVGLHVGASTPFTPAGQIDVVAYLELQNV
jgi:hypothetical protein